MKKKLIVAGGGFTGVAAAISAARGGMDVTIIEQTNCLGGAAAFSLISPFMPFWTRHEDGSRDYLSAGFFREMLNEFEKYGILHKDECHFAEEPMKLVLDRMVLREGVRLLYNCRIIGCKVEDGRIISVTAHDSAQNIELEADYFADCTGDGNLMALAGVPYEMGRSEDGLCQPMTLCFRLGNLEPERFSPDYKKDIQRVYKEYKAAGKITNPREDVLLFHTMLPNILHFNTTRIVKLNPTDPWDVTRAEIMAKEQIWEMIDMLCREIPGFEHAELLNSASRMGVRESRRLVGLHMLNAEELKDCVQFDDSIAVANYDIDIHNPSGSGTSHYYFPAGKYYSIPYRSLVPAEGADNLIVAGRCVSATHEAQASIRIMPICTCMGHAAGVAAAIAARDGVMFAEANVTDIQAKLRAEGARID